MEIGQGGDCKKGERKGKWRGGAKKNWKDV